MSNQSAESTLISPILEKLKNLVHDNRTYKNRLLLSFVVNFAFVFTFLFFGPIELTSGNLDSLVFNVVDVVVAMSLVTIIALIILSALTALLKGRLFNYIVTCEFSFSLCCYIQGNFLNGNLGLLDGDGIIWQKQASAMLLNLLLIIVIFTIPFVIYYFSKKHWPALLKFISILLVAMQLIALITILPNALNYKQNNNRYYLATNNMYEYSKNLNIFVFLLDRLDYSIIENITNQNPDFFKGLDGFTSYTNAISEYARTCPAANYMLTNNTNAYRIPSRQYFEESWQRENVLSDISAQGYTVNVYTELASMFGNGTDANDYVHNISDERGTVNYQTLGKNFIKLSAYRYLPLVFKPFFWCYTDEINKELYNNNAIYEIDEYKYSAGINNIYLKNDKQFKFFHFNDSHPPFTLNEHGEKSETETTYEIQTKGSFNIVFKTIDKLKELGAYKNTAIIILGDHGIPVSDSEPVSIGPRIGLFYKPAGIEGTVLRQSKAQVSLKNIPATIAKEAGINYEKYGRPLDEIKESEELERFFYKSVTDGSNVEKKLYTYSIIGDASKQENWNVLNVEDVRFSFY